MNHLRKSSNVKLIIMLIVIFILGTLSTVNTVHAESKQVESLLPQYEGYSWTYHGFVEYGHEMKISSITKINGELYYAIDGEVYDASGGESGADYSLSLAYIVKPDVIVQEKEEEMMQDSKYDRIELIRGPLEVGTNWTQEVEYEGVKTTLESSITKVESEENERVYTVLYEDVNSPYYEKRKIKENTGVIFFEKLMLSETGNYEVTYSIYDEGSGVHEESNFNDVSMNEWYMDYVPPLASLSIIEGYPDDSFRPDHHVTVAEFIKLTLHSLSYTDENGLESWYDPHVDKAIRMDLISADEFSDYNRPITREEMTKIMVKAYEETPSSEEPNYSDANKINTEYIPYVQKATELGIIEGYPSDNSFRPEEYTTRAEASKMFHLLVQKIDENQLNLEFALSQEEELLNRLYQNETQDWKVRDYDTKEGLIGHILPILDNRELVEKYVDRFYKQEQDGLYFLAQDGIATVNERKPYRLVMINPREMQMVQEDTNELRGHYKLIVTYEYDHKEWIMKDREIIIYNNGSETAYYEVLNKEEMSEEMQNTIDSYREQRGYAVLEKADNEVILFIGSGEKNTGGYAISVNAVHNLGGTTQVFVEESSPQDDEVVNQVITYPMTLIKISNPRENLQAVTTNSSLMTEIEGAQ